MQNINFKVTNTEVPPSLKTLVEQKFAILEKFLTGVTSCDVEFEKVTHHQHGNVFRVEVNLRVDGKLYRAEATLDSFEKAIDEVRNELDRELSRDHDKRDTRLKRAGRKLKEMLRFG